MKCIEIISADLPDWSKDIRLNLSSVIEHSSLDIEEALGSALATSFSIRDTFLVKNFKESLPENIANAALIAASLMGMNNIWYSYVGMVDEEKFQELPAQLRMGSYSTHGYIQKERFEMFALASSIVGKCSACTKAHYKNLRNSGFTLEKLRDIGRIVSVVNAVSQVLKISR